MINKGDIEVLNYLQNILPKSHEQAQDILMYFTRESMGHLLEMLEDLKETFKLRTVKAAEA